MAPEQDLLKIGEFARLAKTSLRTIRYYEELGLLTPVCRRAGGIRYFDRVQLDRVAATKRLQDLNLSLEEIAEIIAPNKRCTGQELLDRVHAALQRQVELTKSRTKALQKDLRELDGSRRKLGEMCGKCDVEFSRENCDHCLRGPDGLPAMVRALLC
ncbi:MAG: helix-turn-helix domain-containing protein [Planctomycetota bacterium]|jgi:DNA-binding transcriptional MerR regulator